MCAAIKHSCARPEALKTIFGVFLEKGIGGIEMFKFYGVWTRLVAEIRDYY